jgi:DNA-binding GntR family transcriptional regulator
MLADPLPLTDQAATALRADIVACRLPPGETLSEAALAGRLGLGRAPIRAALARLADEGLVLAIPRRGWVVSPVTMRDIHEVFALRLMLEAEAARLTADRVRTGQVDPALLAAAADLHRAMAENAGNRRLGRQILLLLDESRRMLTLCRGRPAPAEDAAALLDALAAGDAPEATAIVCEQIAAERARVLAALTAADSALVVGT